MIYPEIIEDVSIKMIKIRPDTQTLIGLILIFIIFELL